MGSDAINNAKAKAENAAWMANPANANIIKAFNSTPQGAAQLNTMMSGVENRGGAAKQIYDAAGGDSSRIPQASNQVMQMQSGSLGSALGSFASSMSPIIKAAGIVGGIGAMAGGNLGTMFGGAGGAGGATPGVAGLTPEELTLTGGIPAPGVNLGTGGQLLPSSTNAVMSGYEGVSTNTAAGYSAGGGGTPGGGGTLGTLGGILKGAGTVGGLLSSIGGLLGPSAGSQGATAQNMLDPFSPYRAQYAAQLNQFMGAPPGDPYAKQLQGLVADPASVQNMPGYQAQLQQGTQAVQRQAAQQGGTQSGRELMALQDYASGQQNTWYQQQLQNLQGLSQYQQATNQQQFSNLSQLSGAGTSPSVGGQAGVNAMTNAATAQSRNLGGVFTGLGQLGNLMGSGQTQTSNAMNTPVDSPGI